MDTISVGYVYSSVAHDMLAFKHPLHALTVFIHPLHALTVFQVPWQASSLYNPLHLPLPYAANPVWYV